MKKIIPLMTVLFILSANNVMAQGPCKADFDCNGGVDAGDVGTFLEEWNHRTIYNNPCPCVETDCLCNPARVPKTGQTTCYLTGDDGDLERGVEWPNPRFMDNGDGTVTDDLTGLIWLKNANCFGARTWYYVPFSDCDELASGSHGLTDGSRAGDWRLPNRFELESLIDLENYSPALPTGHPFTNVQSYYYWSSSSYAYNTYNAWLVHMGLGFAHHSEKSDLYHVWCVRGGH